jgi:bisphosphoglycerate-dependent phosphoglycerate mutase
MAKSRFEHIQHIRGKLGCGLREAADFYEQNTMNVEERLAAQLELTKTTGVFYESPLEKVRAAIKTYYAALDQRKDANIEMDKAWRKIEQAMGMQWEPGATLVVENKTDRVWRIITEQFEVDPNFDEKGLKDRIKAMDFCSSTLIENTFEDWRNAKKRGETERRKKSVIKS